MNKQELAKKVAERKGFPVRTVSAIVDDVFETAIGELLENEEVKIRGFGTFRVGERLSRRYRNPVTGNLEFTARKRHVVFSGSPILKERLNGK